MELSGRRCWLGISEVCELLFLMRTNIKTKDIILSMPFSGTALTMFFQAAHIHVLPLWQKWYC